MLKVTPPRLQKSGLFRSRLSCAGPDLKEKVLIFVRAPEGFGKTSLLGQWRREWLRSGAVVAWLTLDERDDPPRFLQGLIAAMRLGCGRPAFGQGIGQRGDHGGLDTLTEWLADVSDLSQDVVLMLDDAHSLPDQTLNHSLAYLLRNLPPNLRMAIGSREPVALPTADIANHGQFTSLTVDSLSFRLDETIALLGSRFKSDIRVDHCARLHDFTEGWPLGLALAMAVIEKGASVSEAVDSMTAGAHHLEGHFIDTLMARLPDPLAAFLVRISPLDAIHPELCQAATGRQDSPLLLDRLRAATPIFVEALDSPWMRIHALARRYLRRRFDSLAAEERRDLHRRAADWLARQGMYETAARHAFNAGDNDLAYDLIEKCLLELLHQGHVAEVLEWKERLPAAVVEGRTRLRLAIGWALGLSERHAEAPQLLQPLLDDPAASPAVQCECAMIIGAATYYADDLDRAVEILAPWVGGSYPEATYLTPTVANLASMSALCRGLPEQARYHLSRGGDDGRSVAAGTAAWAAWLMAQSYLWEGQAALAEGILRPALLRAEAGLGRRNPVAVMLATSLALALWEQDLPAEVEALLADRLQAMERVISPDAAINGYLAAARLAVSVNEERRALDLLQGLYAIGEMRHLPRLCVTSLGEQIRLNALRGRRETCRDLCRRLDAMIEAEGAGWKPVLARRIMLKAHLGRAHAALAFWDLDAAAVSLEQARALAEQLRMSRDGLEIMMLRALIMDRRREDGASLFREALDLAKTYGLRRILADTHPLLVEWERKLTSTAMPAVPAAEPKASPPPRTVPVGLLTPKESEVLHLVASNMTNKEIALVLDVGDETVKWHMKNLFGKLNAATRKHLVDRARMLGFIDAVD